MRTGIVRIRQRVTEQVNVITIFITVVLSAVCYGWIEGTLYPYYPFKEQFAIANHFTWYHVVFLTLFLVVGFSLSLSRTLYTGLRRYYLVFASFGSVAWGFWIEDMSYFSTRYPSEILASGVWVEWGLSGFHFFGHWIPLVYVLLCSGGFSLFGFAFIVAKRDPIAYRMTGPQQPARKQVTKLLGSHVLLITASAIIVELTNLVAASITNWSVPVGASMRLFLITIVVIVFPLLLLTVMDSVAKSD